MIAIVNMGPHDDKDKMGERTYSVRINADEITQFKHRRSDGLATCLRKAADAVDLKQEMEYMRYVNLIAKDATVEGIGKHD